MKYPFFVINIFSDDYFHLFAIIFRYVTDNAVQLGSNGHDHVYMQRPMQQHFNPLLSNIF